MGRAYEEGQGMSSSFVEAMKWYRLAAEKGHVTAQYKLGLMYGQSRGAPRDLVEAHRWMTLAASRPQVPESGAQNRDAAVALTPAQLAEANKLVRNWEQQGAGR
jgi:TPR repeat protein